MGFDLEKRLANELNRAVDEAAHDQSTPQRSQQVERLKQLAAELKARLLGTEVSQAATPGKRTEIDDVVASALQKFDAITQQAKRGFNAALPWQQQQRATFDDYRATGLRE